MQYAERLNRLGTEGAFEVLARAKRLEAEGKSIIHLEIGEPDFETPKNICDAGIEAIRRGETHYGPSAGLPIAREAVAAYMTRTRKTAIKPENVIIMPGAKPLISNVIFAIINEGDEVIVPDFTMASPAFAVEYTGAKPVFVDVENKTWNIDPNKIEENM